jgi:hypothetical protein
MDEKRMGGVDDGIRAEFSLLLLPASAVVVGVETIIVTFGGRQAKHNLFPPGVTFEEER